MANPVEFYFDFASPYGYVAATQIGALATKYGRQVSWRPFLLGAVFKITGSGPLPTLPLKGDYSLRDMPRSARFLGIPFKMPTTFPISTQAPARAVYWSEQHAPDKVEASVTACTARTSSTIATSPARRRPQMCLRPRGWIVRR